MSPDQAMHIQAFHANERGYAAVADVAAQFPADLLGDFEYGSGAELRAFDESFEGTNHLLKRYVALEDTTGRVLGYAQLFHIPWLAQPGQFWCSVRVHPSYQRRGIGGRLYEQILLDLSSQNASAVQIMVHESAPELAASLARRGFRELFRSWPFDLDIECFDATPFQQVPERMTARGIAIETLSAIQRRDPEWLPKLYDLHTTLTRDIPLPGQPHPSPPLEWFADYAASSPASLPDAFFIALDGERYVGESCMHRAKDAPFALDQKVTGVRREYRGYGIALALKLKTIAYAREHGYPQIRTAVESNNPSMLALNAKLGFVQQPGLILFEKRLVE
jgi:mycothiol synthase